MPVSSFDALLERNKNSRPISLAVALPNNGHVLGALALAVKHNLIKPKVFGDKKLIEDIAYQKRISLESFTITNLSNSEDSINTAIESVKDGSCRILMKGDQSTASIMSPVLKRTNNLRESKTLSHVFVMQVPSYKKLLTITDGALNICPSASTHIGILKNAISVASILGINTPKIALLSAVEVPTAKMPSTIVAQEIMQNNDLKRQAIIEGPMAFDAAINYEAAHIKHMTSEIAGDIDIAHVPNIEAGNILAKALIYLANARSAGMIVGAKIPIVLTSRSDSVDSKLLSIALACLYINRKNNA